MEEGFLLGVTDHRNYVPLEWVQGAPEKRWYGLRLRGKRRIPMQAFRCQICGRVKIQAPEATD